jgi:hypothetical protein
VEAGITRFLAVFHSDVPDVIGPIRSGRLVDAGIVPAYSGILVYSGARADVQSALRRTGAVLLEEGESGVYRDRSRRAPHNLYAEGPRVLETGVARGADTPAAAFLTFDDQPPAGARDCTGPDASCDAEQFTVRMSGQAQAGWTYEAGAGVYRRAQNGTPQPTASGTPVGAANVVVLGMRVGPGGCCDSAGSRYVETQVTGEGRAVVLRDGRWYEATWRKPDPAAHLELLLDGAPLPLRPGPTWIHLAPAENLPAAP